MRIAAFLLASLVPRLQGEPPLPRAAGAMAEARARIQALVAGPSNTLSPFRPSASPGTDTRPGTDRAVPAVLLSTPWKEGESLWLQVPEHVWTHLAARPDERRPLFFGEDSRKLQDKWGPAPFPPRAPGGWSPLADGGLAFTCELAGGVRVSFQVLPGERMFELRFGLENDSGAALLGNRPQFCVVFEEFETLGSQTPSSYRLPVDGTLVDWGAFGQELGWIEKLRDPLTERVVRPCFLLGLVSGCSDERFASDGRNAKGQLWLARTLDLPLFVKSSSDGKRHLVLYSPNGQTVMTNLLSPCAHVDPVLERVDSGEERWGVLYGLFFEGELGPLAAGLVDADRELRCANGFEGE